MKKVTGIFGLVGILSGCDLSEEPRIDSYGECKIGDYILKFQASRDRQYSNDYQFSLYSVLEDKELARFNGNDFNGQISCDDGSVLNLENGIVTRDGEINSE